MFKNEKARWITRTAVLIALLIVIQASTAVLNSKILTGTLVNLLLIMSVMISGLSSGVTIAAFSPIFAKFFGIGPLWSLIPFIMAGNLVLVLIWHFIANRHIISKYVSYIIAIVLAAVAKFLVLYLGIVRFAVPVLLQLPEAQASIISATFSVPQLLTALLGGAIAFMVVPLLKNALAKNKVPNSN